MEEKIFNIVKNEFSALVDRIQHDFTKNYRDKKNNFLLGELDPLMTAHMVFVSSFESKSGNSLQRIARKIAILRYGKNNVPLIINPHNIPHNITLNNDDHEQIVVTNVNIDASIGKVASFIEQHGARGRGTNRIETQVTHESIKMLLNNLTYDNSIHQKPVDLAFWDETNTLNIMEIKAGGDLDTSNARANAEKLLLIYVALNIENAKPYFATYYHKNGENNTWKGIIKKHLKYPEMFLIGSAFWNKILPANIDFVKFTQIYNAAMKEINLNEKLNNMIENRSE